MNQMKLKRIINLDTITARANRITESPRAVNTVRLQPIATNCNCHRSKHAISNADFPLLLTDQSRFLHEHHLRLRHLHHDDHLRQRHVRRLQSSQLGDKERHRLFSSFLNLIHFPVTYSQSCKMYNKSYILFKCCVHLFFS